MHSLIEIHPLNTETGNREVVRISSVQDARINSLGGYKWRPCIIEQPSMNINLFDGDFNTAIQTGGGRFSFNIISILRDYPDFAAYALQGCRISIYVGEDNDTWPWVKLFEGNINRFEQSENKFSCSFRVDADKFAIDILSDTYAGTGGADGGSDLENRPKPWIFGFARNVEPLLINVVDNIYQFSSYGPIKEVLALYERGSDFGSKIDDFADYSALLNANVPPGSWATCNEEGLIRLGAPAAGVITGDVEGDYHDGVFRRSPGEIVKRMAEHLGLNLTDLNIPSLDFVDAELSTWPQNGYVNLVIQNQISLIDLVQALARGCNYQSGVDWLGRLFWVKPQVSLSHSLSLHAQGLRLPKVTNSSQVDVSPPYSTIEMGGVRSHRVHNISEIATDLRLLGGYSATRVYVLDDVVSLPDNSTWRWQNTENGNSFPSQSSSDWELLTDAIQINLGDSNVTGTLPVGKAVPELINENITIDGNGVINGIGTVDAAVLNSQVDTGVNLIEVGTGVVSNNAVTKTGGFGFNGGAYSAEASDSFYVSFKYDFSTFVNRSYVCLSKDAQPDGTNLNNTVAYVQVDGIGDFLRLYVDGVRFSNLTVLGGDIPSRGICTVLYDGRLCRFFVDGVEYASRSSQDENVIVRALILPQNSGKMTELQSISYGQANNSTWEQIRNSGSAGVPADNATANVSLIEFGPQLDRISLLANRMGSTAATNNSGVHTLTSHNGSCLLEFTVNGVIGCAASIYDTTEYVLPSDRFTPAKYHALVGGLNTQDQTFTVQIRQEVDGANLFRGTFTGFNFGDTVGLRYDGVAFALLRNGEVIDLDVAEAGLNVRGSIIPQGNSQGVFAIDEIDWTAHTDNSSESVGGFGLTEMEIRNPTLTNDGILSVDINGSPINLGAVTISGIGYVGDLDADLTSRSQVVAPTPPAQIINRNSDGTVKVGEFPRTLTPMINRGGTDIRTDSGTSYSFTATNAFSGVSLLTGVNKGRLQVNDGDAGTITLTATVDGVDYPIIYSFETRDDPIPTTSGGTSSGAVKQASDNSFPIVQNSGAEQPITRTGSSESVFLINVAAGESLKGQGTLSYAVQASSNDESASLSVKWQYKLPSSSNWLDFGTYNTGALSQWIASEFSFEPASVNTNQTVSGLAADDYEVRAVAEAVGTNPININSGTLNIVAQP